MPDISGGHIDTSAAGWALQEGTPKKNLAAPALAKNSRHDPAVDGACPTQWRNNNSALFGRYFFFWPSPALKDGS